MKIVIGISIIALLLIPTIHAQTDIDKDNDMVANALCQKLETAFQLSSNEYLEQFFTNWNESVTQNASEFIKQNDIVEAIYEIYKEVFNPFDLNMFGNIGKNNDLNCKYVVVSNKIYYSVIENTLMEISDFDYMNAYKQDSINDFRPPLKMAKEQTLYLLPEYEKALDKFVGVEFVKSGRRFIKKWLYHKPGNRERYEFLRPYIPIHSGHWGGMYHTSQPFIYHIILDKNISYARVSISIHDWGYGVILKKEANVWKIVKSELIFMT